MPTKVGHFGLSARGRTVLTFNILNRKGR